MCLLCDASMSEGSHRYMLCGDCIKSLTNDPLPSCPRCSSSVGSGLAIASDCIRCESSSFAFATSIRFGTYEAKFRDAVLRMKHSNGESLAETIGLLWVDHHLAKFQALKPQIVIPVPLHYWRQWNRGYNQATALARMVAGSLNVPMQSRWLRRIRNTLPQTAQSASARRENVKDAFKLSRFAQVKGKRVLLIDDVLTTGATADAAAKALRDGGSTRIDVAILSRR